MNTNTKKAIATLRAKLGLKRLDPRRLYFVDDGTYRWIGDRADLTTDDALYLSALHAWAQNQSEPQPRVLRDAPQDHYSSVCGRCPCVSVTHGAAGMVPWDALPECWQDGTALGSISILNA